MRCVADDAIYTSHTLHSLPHRLRIRQILSEIRHLALKDVSYADVGCGGGAVTQRIVDVLRPVTAVGYDSNQVLVETANRFFTAISFRVASLTQTQWSGETYDLVTCLETLEHVADLEGALDNLLRMTTGTLLVTVPIETGLLGLAKFGAKVILGKKPLTDEHTGSRLSYVRALITGGDISRFRVRSRDGRWLSHSGFDYRQIDRLLESQRVNFVAKNRGWNRFYRVTKQ